MEMKTIELDRCVDCKYFVENQDWCDKKDKETNPFKKKCGKFELAED